MVTADVGFAVLVNASRFPAFIRGEDVIVQLRTEKSRREALEAEVLARTKAEEALAESEKLRLAETDRRERFVRDVMLAATMGRLRLHYKKEELPEPLLAESEPIEVTTGTIQSARRKADRFAAEHGISGDRHSELISAVAESLMNAVVHAGGGVLTMSHDEKDVQYRIVDNGSGIEWRDLPYATLQQGWSSKGTLGLGFTLMMLADTVNLFTSAAGTTVVLTMSRT
jgi:anti-sigma regulatory factor (Ser/Thr protein kinase)